MKNKIIDCFTFYNELELLYYRLNVLYEYVDYFVLVEANHTYAGNKKQLYYEDNKYLFKKFNNKIIHIIVDLPHIYPNISIINKEQWINEYYQRNSIDLGIKLINDNKVKLKDDDMIIISDLDEIINPNIFNKINGQNWSLNMDFYYYNLNTKINTIWNQSKIINYYTYTYKTTNPQDIRTKNKYNTLNNAGWHLSYFGDVEFISNKIQQFAHQEFNNNFYTNPNNIKEAIENNKDIFRRNYENNIICKININDNINKPPLYNIFLNNYYEDNEAIIKTKKTYIYFHICCLNNYEDIVKSLLFNIKNSGLYNYIDEIRCVILGQYNPDLFNNYNKINIIYNSLELNLRENYIFNLFIEDSKKEDFNMLYINSKGVKYDINNKYKDNIYDLVEYLVYFNIYNYKLNVKLLEEGANVIGVNLQDKPELHYSGNFFWTNSNHLKLLSNIEPESLNAKFKICSIKNKFISLWNTNINHYETPYHFTNYINKEIKYICPY
jgi:beta-1,4-mannosyl-glycoprotein beta-1,4-N-acetylglucosaminyltransferase